MASVLEFIDDYRTGYHYQLGGNGVGGGIDCSHLVYAVLKKAGYDFAYSPVATMEVSGNFQRIAVKDAKPGDLAIYINHHGGTSDHVGIIISINEQSNGIYFGSQSSTGPANTQFGPDARYWKAPNYILRPKEAKTPAATPAVPPPKIQLLKWSYPVKLKGGSAKFTPDMYFKGLSKALGGSYPLGNTGLLHPAIHIDLGTASFIDHKLVEAIADGQIVAYRMDPEPLNIHYPGATDAAKYSSSFVLIKHKLQLPPKPAAPASAPEPESIILYSLYMHLADAKAYADAVQKLEKPPYLSLKFKVKNNVTKPLLGLRVRDKPGGYVLGLVPLLGKAQTGAPHPSNPKWKKFNGVAGASLAQVNELPAGKTPTTDGYIFTGTLNSSGIVVSDADSEPTRISTKVTYVYNQDKAAGRKVIANLPVGAILELGAKSKIDGSFYELRSAENLQNYPAPKDSAGKIIGWVDKDDLEEQPLTPPAGVQILNPPVEVKAGQLIGHPGVFQNHNNGSAQVQLHIELFTPDDLPAFIEKGRAWAQDPNVKLGDKTLLKVPKGVELIALIKDGEQKIQPPKSTDPKTAIHSELILPLSALNALPADHKQSLPESEAANAKKLQWWLLENVGGQADGTTITGWLCENQVTRVSPWEWPGFVTLEDDTPDEKLIAYQLKIANKLQGEELSTFSNIVAEAQQWPVTKQLIKTIKENVVEDVDVSDSLTSAELTKAYKGYWCAQKISSIAVKTKTEWKKDPARWNALDKIMGHKEDTPNENWLTEKTKIEKLSFWDDVSSVTGNSDGKVWFLNPLLTATFLKGCPPACVVDFFELQTSLGLYRVSKKLMQFILDTEAYKEYPYALSDDLSGITIGYGYDLGQQTSSQIETDLDGLYKSADIDRLKSMRTYRGANARAHVGEVSDIPISKDDALKLALRMKRRYAQQVVDVYPEVIELHPDVQGAMLSLVINRGNSLVSADGRRKEMLEIQSDLKLGDYKKIPIRFRSMKRLWTTSANRGVAIRREREAEFIESSINCNCWRD